MIFFLHFYCAACFEGTHSYLSPGSYSCIYVKDIKCIVHTPDKQTLASQEKNLRPWPQMWTLLLPSTTILPKHADGQSILKPPDVVWPLPRALSSKPAANFTCNLLSHCFCRRRFAAVFVAWWFPHFEIAFFLLISLIVWFHFTHVFWHTFALVDWHGFCSCH